MYLLFSFRQIISSDIKKKKKKNPEKKEEKTTHNTYTRKHAQCVKMDEESRFFSLLDEETRKGTGEGRWDSPGNLN